MIAEYKTGDEIYFKFGKEQRKGKVISPPKSGQNGKYFCFVQIEGINNLKIKVYTEDITPALTSLPLAS